MTERDAAMHAAIRAACAEFGDRCSWPECRCYAMPARVRAAIAAWQAAQPASPPPKASHGMTERARRVIDDALEAWINDDNHEPTRTDQILSAFAGAGLAIVPRRLTAVMAEAMDAAPSGSRDPNADPITFWQPTWLAAIAAAEAEAKGGDPEAGAR